MVQVIGAGTPRGQSFGQRLGAGVGKGLESGQKMYQQHQERQAMKELGIPENLPPELQKALLTENLKAQSKEKLLKQKGEMLGFGGTPKGVGMGEKLQEGEPSQQERDPVSYSDDEIARMTLIDRDYGHAMQHAKDVALREKSSAETRKLEREKFEHRKSTESEKEKTRKLEILKKETEPVRKEISDRAELARRGIENKEKLIEIINSGNIDDPTYAAFLEALPGNIGKRFLSPETVEYKAALVQNFSDLKTLFTGATRVKEIEILEGKIPDIYLTDQQKKQILMSSIEGHKADLLKEEAAEELEAEVESGKRNPMGLIQYRKTIDDKLKPKLDALANRVIDQQKAIIKDAENRKKIALNPKDPEDLEIIDQILKEAGGDYKAAEKLAKKKGYAF